MRLTIKSKPGGPVSNAAQTLRAGEVVRLGCAQGDFRPRSEHGKLLLLCAGSGITPMASLLHGLAAERSNRDVVLLHCVRSAEDLLFRQELQALQGQWPALRLHPHLTRYEGRLDAGAFAHAVPDWPERETLLCGPDGFMQVFEALYAARGLGARLQSESFGRRAAPVDPMAVGHEVRYGTATPPFVAKAGQSLLEAAEAVGLKPRYGCRRGICRTCQCHKQSGTVLNLLTGQQSGPGPELIQLCISTPQSALELAPRNTP